jgi:REP element-mobilizing transposase RayT
MPRARKHLVCLDSTPYYHVVSRCVRRAFLCGKDRFTGKSFEHRRGWIESRVRQLATAFSIEICAYAIMSNHYHLVVKLVPQESNTWNDDEVLKRWTALFKGPILVQRYRLGECLTAAERETLAAIAAVYRKRLASLSWFMKCLNEPIARKANAEDHCTGHFWEARFHSQPLCSDRAVLAAMAYVDLNPVRAGIARTPESSAYTSLRARLRETRRSAKASKALVRPLMPFSDSTSAHRRDVQETATLPIRQHEYLELVDMAGRVAVRGKTGRITPAVKPILERLGMKPDEWVRSSTQLRQALRGGELLLKKSA